MKRFSTTAAITAGLAAAFTLTLFLPGCGGGSSSTPPVTARPKPRAKKAANGPVAQNGQQNNQNGAPAGGTGSLSGVIKFTGTPPKNPGKPPNYVAKEFCMNPMIANKIVDDSLLVGPNGGLQNVIIYLDRKPPGYSAPAPEKKIPFDNVNCMFKPRVLALRAGQIVEVGNKDQVAHNTHTNPLVGTGFNQNIAPGQTAEYTYDPARVPVKVNCDVHPWMLAWQLPLDHEFFAVTDEIGEFTIENLPAGTHTFNVWHEKAGWLARRVQITINPGENTYNKDVGPAEVGSYNGPKPSTVVLNLDGTSSRGN